MRQLKITKQVTNRETASLDKYLQEIGKVDLITADEEVELAQRIKEREAQQGRDVEVYVDCRVKVNGGKYYKFIDPEVDLAAEPWQHFKHHDWILPSPEDYHAYDEADKSPQK